MLAADNVLLLEQLMVVVRQLPPEVYTRPGEGPVGSSVGGHVRHIYDHYRALLAGLRDGRIDYEQRERDPRIEREPDLARARLRDVSDALAHVAADRGADPVQVQSGMNVEGRPRWCGSTLARELDVLAMHDVHHHALIAGLLRQAPVLLPEGFGVAPATRRYLETQGSCAP